MSLSYLPRMEVKIRVKAPLADVSPNTPLKKAKLKEITLTLISDEDFKAKGVPELRRIKLTRMLKEAEMQRASLPYALLSQLLCSSEKTICRDISLISSRSSIKTRMQIYREYGMSKKSKGKKNPREAFREKLEEKVKGKDKVFSETLRFLCEEYMKIKNRRKLEKIPELMEEVIKTCDGKTSITGKVKRVIEEFKSAGIFLSRGWLYYHLEAVELACKKLEIGEGGDEIVDRICERIEDLVNKGIGFRFRFRYIPLIVIEECRKNGVKVDEGKVLNAFGFPESVYKEIASEFARKCPSFKISVKPEVKSKRAVVASPPSRGKVKDFDSAYPKLIKLAREELSKLSDKDLLRVILVYERSLAEIYDMFLRIKPGKSKSSIRGTVNRNVSKLFKRTGEGKYVAIDRGEGKRILTECARRCRGTSKKVF